MRIQDFFADTLIVGLSSALLWHFSNIWRYGQYLVKEPNIAILCIETAGLLIILGFGTGKFVRDIKAKRGDKDHSQRGH